MPATKRAAAGALARPRVRRRVVLRNPARGNEERLEAIVDARLGLSLRLLVAAWHLRPGQTFQPLVGSVEDWEAYMEDKALHAELGYVHSWGMFPEPEDV